MMFWNRKKIWRGIFLLVIGITLNATITDEIICESSTEVNYSVKLPVKTNNGIGRNGLVLADAKRLFNGNTLIDHHANHRSLERDTINMDLGYDDKLWDEWASADVKYYVKFPQYFELPYKVTKINIATCFRYNQEVVLFPDNGSGLPDTTETLLTASYSWSCDKDRQYHHVKWVGFTVNGDGIIDIPGPLWLEYKYPPDIEERKLCIDNNSVFGMSYYYDGDYHQFTEGNYMMRIVVEGVALEHDVLVKSVDIPHRYTVPAEHSIIPRIFIENAGQSIETFGVTCVIDSSGCNIYTSTFPFPVTINPQSTIPITFAPWDVGGENSVYDITFYTQLEEDMYPSNDTLIVTVTASLNDTIRYDFDMACVAVCASYDANLIVRVTPQAYPCKLMEVMPCFWGAQATWIQVIVMEDANPENPDIFEPGDVIWSGYRQTTGGTGYQHFDLSEENIIIYESDVEVYVCIVSPAFYMWFCLGNYFGDYNPTNRFNNLTQPSPDYGNYLIPVAVNYLPQVGVEDMAEQIPQFALRQNYPNPFSTSTTISFSATDLHGLPLINIYNIRGQLVKTLIQMTNDKCPMTSIIWDGKDERGKYLPSGIYLYRITAGDFIDTKKCVILK
ncbi:MAG: T9SS type A sorting domain-containing protein [Candidatus Cloacimonetes bacterium]|nr:T9SS type A sorting domain-containing protein [Candidatus Cloacimonadota bacterium]